MEDYQPYSRIVKAMIRQQREDEVFMTRVQTAFEELNLHNSIYAELLVKLAGTLVTYSINSIEDPAGELELDRDRGMTVNVAAAVRGLKDYSAPLREFGEQIVDLDKSLLAIFREKERRILNDL